MGSESGWRARAGTFFAPEKSPVTGSRGVVATNHPLASAAGAQMLADGGNAVDAAVAALFMLNVVEPMMVGVFGGGWTNVRLADGESVIVDNYTTAPAAAAPDMFEPLAESGPAYLHTVDRMNQRGFRAVGVPGTLKAWTEMVDRWGRLDLPSVMAPAIDRASRGFRVGSYLCDLIVRCRSDLARSPDASGVFLPGGEPLRPGEVLCQPELAESLRLISDEGPEALYGGSLGTAIVDAIARGGGVLTLDDLRGYRTARLAPLVGEYRGYKVAVPPPPNSGGWQVLQCLRLLEGFDVATLGFGTADSLHLLAECCKISFSDADPRAVDPPSVESLLADAHIRRRRAEIDMARATSLQPGGVAAESADTTHVTAADADGNVVSMTQTIHSPFGAKVMAPGTGILLNNTMALFDPHPGRLGSITPGKRMTSRMAPAILTRDGQPFAALGTPGGVRIFPSVLQALVNLIDHRMDLQEAIEAPRMWAQDHVVEVEPAVPSAIVESLAARGHQVRPVPTVAGGMNGIQFNNSPGVMTGAACWRADGVPVALGGGQARSGAEFRTTARS